MDRKKAKKIRDARIIATNIFMGVMVVLIVFVLMFIAMGYNFNPHGKIDQSGLVQIFSTPSGASVEIDGDLQFSRTTINKMLSPGDHNFKITRNGYDSWYNNFSIESGLLTRIDWVRLFPLQPDYDEPYSFEELETISYSPSRKYLLAHEKNSNYLLLFNIHGDNIKPTRINLQSAINSGDKYDAKNDKLAIVSWSNSDSSVLVRRQNTNGSDWILVNLDKAEDSINLSHNFTLNFSNILFANDSGSKLWAIESGKLHEIDTSNKTISKTIDNNIEIIANNSNVVAYTKKSTESDGMLDLFTYKEGDEAPVLIESFKPDTENAATIVLGTYWNEQWIAISTGKRVTILDGHYPNYGKDEKSLEISYERDLDFVPTMSTVGNNQRIIVFADKNNFISYDVENKSHADSQFDGEIGKINWLDSYILWEWKDGNIVIRDFDGNNRREILSGLDNQLPIVINDSEKWLYFFEITETVDESSTDAEDSVAEQTEQTEQTEPAEQETPTTEEQPSQPRPQIHYILKREKLTI